MDRMPKPAPFAVGTRLLYAGSREWYATVDGKNLPVCAPGMEVTVTEARKGRRGTLKPCRDEEGVIYNEETGDAILDTTRDGYSVYMSPAGMGRCINVSEAAEWEVLVSSSAREGE